MKILPNLIIERNALIHKKTLIISDLHIGLDEALHNEGFFAPKFQYKDLLKNTLLLIKKYSPNKIIINGDIKHSFKNSFKENKKLEEYLDIIKKHAEIIIIKGNHDVLLENFLSKKNLSFVDYYVEHDMFICHGHKKIVNKQYEEAKTLVLGHDHPSIIFKRNSRFEKYKCYLVKKIKKTDKENKNIILMPSFNPNNEGSDILTAKFMSPYLKKVNVDEFEVYVTQEETYFFGTIKKLRSTGHI